MKKYRKQLILASFLTLLPIPVGLILRNRFPDPMAIHFGLNGQADGFASPLTAIFLLPLIMLLGLWVTAFLTLLDNRDQNHKPIRLVFWILPITANLISGIFYAMALGMEFSMGAVMCIGLGIMFFAIGNYLPKCRRNYTVGIRVKWTFSSEENWNATHRFAGKVWTISSILMCFTAFLPGYWNVGFMIAETLALGIMPTIYSYRFYRRQVANGDQLDPLPKTYRKITWFAMAFTAVILIFVGVMLFTGSLQVRYDAESFTVEASYYEDLTVNYDEIQAIDYREGNVDGIRLFGLGSFRLLLGTFQNEEFGKYTRYTYYRPESCVILTVNDRALVLSGRDRQESQAIYDALVQRVGD